MNAVIGALRVNLGLDSAQFQQGLKTGKSRLDQFAATATKAFAAVAAAGVAMAGAFAVGIRNSINEADNMAKAAQRFGTTTEELSRLKHAADLSGVSFEGLGSSMRVLSRNMQEVANGAKNSTAQAFQALGIEVKNTDGTLKSSTQIMQEVAERFSRMEDGAQKTALAMAIFGRSGTDLIPMLNQGADGLRSMMEEADQLGITLDSSTAKAAEEFNDNLTRMARIKDGLIMKVTAELLPALENLAKIFLDLVNDGDKVKQMADGIVEAFRFVARAAASVIGGIAGIRSELDGLMEAGRLILSGDFSGARDAWNEGQETAARIRKDIEDAVEGIFKRPLFTQKQIDDRIARAFGEGGTEAAEQFVANFEEGTTGGGGGRVRAAIDTMAREAARIFEQTRTPLEQYQAQIARLNELLQAGAIDQDTYNRAVLQAQDAFDKASKSAEKSMLSMEQVGQTIAGTISSAFQGLINGSQKVGDVLKNLLSQLTSMWMNQAFQALFSGMGGGGGGILGMLFGGFRANGGPVSSGRAYVVGERGPELMVPNSSGTVIPNHALGGGGGSQQVHVTVGWSRSADGNLKPFIESVSDERVGAGIRNYDDTLPVRVNQISRDPRTR